MAGAHLLSLFKSDSCFLPNVLQGVTNKMLLLLIIIIIIIIIITIIIIMISDNESLFLFDRVNSKKHY